MPAKTGQFITLFSTAEVALKRPDKLRARLTGEAPISISISMEQRHPLSLP